MKTRIPLKKRMLRIVVVERMTLIFLVLMLVLAWDRPLIGGQSKCKEILHLHAPEAQVLGESSSLCA